MIVVVKVGTSSITDGNGDIDAGAIEKLCGEAAALRDGGHRVVLVTSGAIAAGLPALGYEGGDRPRDAVTLQAASAVGQTRSLHRLGIPHAIVLGHSWGASVAVALALTHPNLVQGLVLASGYYYPTLRPDVVALSAPAVPLVGDVLGHTISPIVSRVMWPLLMAKIFGPRSMPKKFKGFPKEMALRPTQIRASAAESAIMIPDAFYYRDEYANLKMPLVIVAGNEDRLVDIDAQSARLHREVPQSKFHRVAGTGHMIHQTATDVVMSAIDEVAQTRSSPN